MHRTVVLDLHPTAEQRAVLRETLAQYTACFNAVGAEGFPAQISNGVELHNRTYYPLRAQYPSLPAQLVCSSRVKATEAVKSALTWQQKRKQAYPRIVAKAQQRGRPIPTFKPARAPRSAAGPIRYDQPSYWVRVADTRASLATVAGRVEVPFTAPHHSTRYPLQWHVVLCGPVPPQGTLVLAYGHEPAVARSARRRRGGRRSPGAGTPRCHLRASVPGRAPLAGARAARLPVASCPASQKHSLGQATTQAAERKQFRQRRDHDHLLSKRIVQSVAPGTTIAIEHLREITDRTEQKGRASRRRHHSWSFDQFQGFLAYKAEERGMRVVKVDPRHTSQTCSRCGFQHRANRRSQSLFHCLPCVRLPVQRGRQRCPQRPRQTPCQSR